MGATKGDWNPQYSYFHAYPMTSFHLEQTI